MGGRSGHPGTLADRMDVAYGQGRVYTSTFGHVWKEKRTR